MSAHVAEIFSSIQGEGPYVGARQVFVRTYGCDLACRYCDTAAARHTTGPCVVELPAGSGKQTALRNPLTVDEVMQQVAALDTPGSAHHSVSITGGEPLLHAAFVRDLAQACRRRGLKAYLETNGQRIRELRDVIGAIDIVAMDVKLSSSLPEGSESEWEPMLARSMAFLRTARSAEVFVKAICTGATSTAEVARVAESIADEAKDCLLVLQPVTPAAGVDARPTASQMLTFQEAAAAHLPNVRVIPQCHLMMGML